MGTFTIKTSDGSIKQVPDSEMQNYGFSPEQISAYQKNVAKPQQDLQQGDVNLQKSQGTLQPDIAKSQAEAQVATQTAPSQVQTAQAGAQVKTNEAQQLKFIAGIKGAFDQVKGKDGYVSPDDFNKAKQAASELNINSKSFDDTFKDSYTNPNNIYYNTEEARPVKEQAQQIYNLVKDYHKLDLGSLGPQKSLLSNLLGKAGIDVGNSGEIRSYENQVQDRASSIRDLVNAGSGSGFRFNNTELGKIADLLPSPSKTAQQNESDITKLNQTMKTAFGVGLDDFIAAEAKGNK